MKIILASSSPRRQQLLAEAGVPFEVHVSEAEEIHDASIPLDELCEKNAELKAAAVAEHYTGDIVIGADTLVWIDGIPLGKPKTLTEARQMLRVLSGRSHTVCTGLCVVDSTGKHHLFHDLTEVQFRELNDDMLEDYFSKVNPLDKAGAYGIQEHGELLISGITGAFDNVMGLPTRVLLEKLKELCAI